MKKSNKSDLNIASVHRFGDNVAAYLGDGGTTYLTTDQARSLARALNACAKSIKDQPKFSESSFNTIEIKKNQEQLGG